jgi:predicted ATP-dependent serine protease
MENLIIEKRRPGRPPGTGKHQQIMNTFDPTSIELIRGKEMNFNDSLFEPLKTKTPLDSILSSNEGLMPATNIVVCGGPGSGKTTIVLDMLSNLTDQGYKCLFVSAEMDEIGFYKYCKRIPKFANVQTIFAKNYVENIREALEYSFGLGYDVIAIDSIAEVIEMYKDTYRTTESSAELWFLGLQDRMKKGHNEDGCYTAFVNIQQVTKAGDFAGSNRLKHMTDGMCSIVRPDKDSAERIVEFSKNRDAEVGIPISFIISSDHVRYSYGSAE